MKGKGARMKSIKMRLLWRMRPLFAFRALRRGLPCRWPRTSLILTSHQEHSRPRWLLAALSGNPAMRKICGNKADGPLQWWDQASCLFSRYVHPDIGRGSPSP